MARREFTTPVRAAIIKRATKNGVQYCEECGCLARRFEIDHTDADALQLDKSRKLTADDGKLLCAGPNSCHARKTRDDVANIARAKRQEAAHIGAKSPSPRGFAKPEKEPKRLTRVAAGVPEIMRRYLQP